jgi:hypothetical protein
MNKLPSYFRRGQGVANPERPSITVGAVPWPVDSEALRPRARSPAKSAVGPSRHPGRETFYAS